MINSHLPVIQENPTNHFILMLYHMDEVHHVIMKHVEAYLALMRKNFIYANILELKTALLGMKSFCKEASDKHILFPIDNPSAILAINETGSMVSFEMVLVVHKIWDWSHSTNNWVTAPYIPGIFNKKSR